MSFAEPLWLWLLVAVPAVAALFLLATRRDARRLGSLVARALWPRVVEQPGPRWRVVRLVLLLVGATSLVVALARPQWGIVRERVEREGVDVVFVLDTSGSMATPDVAPNRFFLARAGLLSLIPRLSGDRLALVAFEGEAYPLVPLTLDADAVGLFLDTLEPGAVPSPGSSLGQGLVKGLDLFVDKERSHKVMVLVSDGEDLAGDVDEAVKKAKELGVVVHTVGVGTEQGQPVPQLDEDGRTVGFKRDEAGRPVVSRLDPAALENIARATGGRFYRLGASEASLAPLASAIEGMEQRTLAREFSYRMRERYQVPLGLALLSFTLGFMLPLPNIRWRRAPTVAVAVSLLVPGPVGAQSPATPGAAPPGAVVDEVLLRPSRVTARGRVGYAQGDHRAALDAFKEAARMRPADPAVRFNLGDGFYKSGLYDEAEPVFRALSADVKSPLAGPARYNLGNVMFQKQDYAGAVQAYKDALRLLPGDEPTRKNLELALRAQKQEEQKKDQDKDEDEKKDQQDQKQQPPDPRQPPKTDQQKEEERFQKEAGMPRDRAMQLLDALQRNEADEQKKQMEKQPQKRTGKDW